MPTVETNGRVYTTRYMARSRVVLARSRDARCRLVALAVPHFAQN